MKTEVFNHFKNPIQMCEEIWIMPALHSPYDTVIDCTEERCIKRAEDQIKKVEDGKS